MTTREAPLEPWVARAREGVIYLGFAWPMALTLYSLFSGSEAFVWGLIGSAFMAIQFTPAAAVLSVLVPTMKARLFGVPILLVGFLSWIADGSNVNYPTGPPLVLWMVTFTAVTMLIPEVGPVRRFYARIFLNG